MSVQLSNAGVVITGALMLASALTPEFVADVVADALGGDQFLILPHPEVAHYYATRAADNERRIAGMNKLQRKLAAAGT